MYIPHTGMVQVGVTDLQGRVVLRSERKLDGGYHSFSFHPGDGSVYFLTARWNGISRSVKTISTGLRDASGCRLDYMGSRSLGPTLKSSWQAYDETALESGILDYPEADTTYVLQFATNIPCPGMPTVEYEGHVYNTIQIFSQCWLKEDLNLGVMIPDTVDPLNNRIIEKYCHSNDPDSCAKLKKPLILLVQEYYQALFVPVHHHDNLDYNQSQCHYGLSLPGSITIWTLHSKQDDLIGVFFQQLAPFHRDRIKF